MLCRHKWIECKERIISANERILSQSGIVSDSLAQDDLEKWLKEIEKEPFYSRINLLLNQLAEHFDDKTNEYRRKRACEEKIKYLRAKHTFIVIPSKQNVSNLYPVTARMYYRDLPPDDRLIKITIDENLTYSRPLLSAFHEMGHFLGSRYRKERYEQYFRPLILNAFF